MKFLFIAKEKPFSKEASQIINNNFPGSHIVFGEIGDEFPTHLLDKKFDYVISYISPWIIPKEILENSKVAAINLHPGPPEYPGIGCTNFAIYSQEKEFGITVHHMAERVDRGEIIMVKRFPLFDSDTVWDLSQRCYIYIYVAFIELIQKIITSQPLPFSEEKWVREPFTRKDLNELCRITGEMSNQEVLRRIKATSFPNMPGAFIELYGKKFIYQTDN